MAEIYLSKMYMTDYKKFEILASNYIIDTKNIYIIYCRRLLPNIRLLHSRPVGSTIVSRLVGTSLKIIVKSIIFHFMLVKLL